MDRQRGFTDEQIEIWANAHIGGGMESPLAIGVKRLLAEKRQAIAMLVPSTKTLAAAVAAFVKPHTAEVSAMAAPAPNPIIDPLVSTVTTTVGVMQSATALINGFQGMLAAGIAAAIAGGATADQLAQLTAVNDSLVSGETALAAAVAANQPPAPVSPPSP